MEDIVFIPNEYAVKGVVMAHPETSKLMQAELSTLRDQVARLTAENATLQTLVPHTGDGTCYVCGSSPAHDVPMCEGCCDVFAKIEEFAPDGTEFARQAEGVQKLRCRACGCGFEAEFTSVMLVFCPECFSHKVEFKSV